MKCVHISRLFLCYEKRTLSNINNSSLYPLDFLSLVLNNWIVTDKKEFAQVLYVLFSNQYTKHSLCEIKFYFLSLFLHMEWESTCS